jgi:PKD repeat protein
VVPDFTIESSTSPCCFINTSQNSTGFLWDFGDGNFSTEVNQCHTYDTINQYIVKLISTNDCDIDSLTKIIEITGIDDYQTVKNEFKLVPNPTNSITKLVHSNLKNPITIRLYDAQNRFISTIHFNSTANEIDLSKYQSGLYFMELIFDNIVYTLKVVKIN